MVHVVCINISEYPYLKLQYVLPGHISVCICVIHEAGGHSMLANLHDTQVSLKYDVMQHVVHVLL